MFTLNCKGKLLYTEIPIVMGIINATPDSFYQGDLQKGINGILNLAQKMIAEGATILDIGGQSTKPNSKPISVQEEIDRVLPVIKMLHEHMPEAILSIDTYQSKVAQEAINEGASIVNDVSAGNIDEAMIETVARFKNIPYVCMHMRGTPANMQTLSQYDNIIKEILDFFIKKIDECTKAGIIDIILDPGFGFAKNIEQNFQLLKNLAAFDILDKPILAGISRKSMIYKSLGSTAMNALNGTTVLNTIALQNGASILRVHDVKEAVEAIKLFQLYKAAV
jgi:dihydropteroate synthase